MTESRGRTTSMPEALIEAQRWRCIGPHRGGRVVAVSGDVSDPMTFYFGACAGGVWKTTDGGTYWENVSDGYFNTAAVGAIAVSESNPNVIYAGTGEATIRGNVSHGDGVYKSSDGGRSWRNVGLADSRHIGRILIHPTDPNLVYVAAFGHAWGPNEERGVFRSRDGRETWEHVLYKSPRAGSHDIAMDRDNPNILYAPIWQAQRYAHALISGGEECGLWRSENGGDSWVEITRNPGLPTGEVAKIGVAASPVQPGRVWALVEAEDGAVFRSDDYGEHWIRLSEQSLLRTRPWYYMHITADTQDADTVWVQNYSFWKSIDGGASFDRVPTPHGDDHALWIDPNDNQRMIEGNDGGACVSFNGGMSWSSIYNQPTAQLYHVTTDNGFPYRVYGSQQDNTAISIPSATADGAIHERDWYAPGGGESGYIAIKPDDPNIVIASGPAGRRAYNDIMTHYDHRTGQKWNITVWPELYGWGAGAESLKYRFQWTFPIMFSQHDPDTLYVASNVLHRSTDLGASFSAISGDLTRNDPDKLVPSGGPVTRDNTGAEVYCTIFTLAESPHEPGFLWAGTDDGLVHASEDGGRHWEDVTPPDLPGADDAPALISIIDPSPHEPGTAYLAATRYKHDDTRPYLYKTTDYGSSWTLITDGIPEDDFTRVIREDPKRPGLLYAGTETGLYISFNDGSRWHRFSGNIPVVPIHDLVIKDDALVVATHGRSFWILDDVNPLRQFVPELSTEPVTIFEPAAKVRMRTYGRSTQWSEGANERAVHFASADTSTVSYRLDRSIPEGESPVFLDAGTNPPFGIVFQYLLGEEVEAGATLRITDTSGDLVREISASGRQGCNRAYWNLRYEGIRDVDEQFSSWSRPDGPLVVPGTYQAELIAGAERSSVPVSIEPGPCVATNQADLIAQQEFLFEILGTLERTNALIKRLASIRRQAAFWREKVDAGDLADSTARIGDVIDAALPKLIDVNIHQSQLYPSGLHEKLNALFESADSADYAPPQQARDVLAQLTAELDAIEGDLSDGLGSLIASFNDTIANEVASAIDPLNLSAH